MYIYGNNIFQMICWSPFELTELEALLLVLYLPFIYRAVLKPTIKITAAKLRHKLGSALSHQLVQIIVNAGKDFKSFYVMGP